MTQIGGFESGHHLMVLERIGSADEERRLAEELARLETLTERLAAREEALATERAAFERFRIAYMVRFAPLYAELDRLTARLAWLHAQDDPRVVEAARAAEERARASAKAEEEIVGVEAEAARDPESEQRLRDLYRKAAKALHPDLAEDDEDRKGRTERMAELNAAYARADEEAMRLLFEEQGSDVATTTAGGVSMRLLRTLRAIAAVERRLDELERMTDELAGDPMFRLFAWCRDSDLNDPLANDEAQLRNRIGDIRRRIVLVTAR